jgi:hypothetical protein
MHDRVTRLVGTFRGEQTPLRRVLRPNQLLRLLYQSFLHWFMQNLPESQSKHQKKYECAIFLHVWYPRLFRQLQFRDYFPLPQLKAAKQYAKIDRREFRIAQSLFFRPNNGVDSIRVSPLKSLTTVFSDLLNGKWWVGYLWRGLIQCQINQGAST